MDERIVAYGHHAVKATHQSTLEVTTDDYLTAAGDCIVGIEADRAPVSFAPVFITACQSATATIRASLVVGELETTITGRGDPAMTFESERGAVIRTSDYVDDRTVLVGADHAAADVHRDLVERLQQGESLTLTLSVDARP